VDPESRRDFWASLFELADAGTTLLVSTHYMDEAERCHRLAILERGRLVADGTPQDLIASLPGRVWLLRSADTRAAEAALRGKPGIIGSAQIGNSLRVLAEPGTDEAALRALLPAAAPESLEAIEPNLEDVFVAATHAARRARGQEQR
jgi:ABC-2 type transport system ATP-binding protein